ncbi:hypothetical protein [Mangrovibrevibacter kandeliae]|uniref:hypothetical protein n=1 Tax=Mangrovibrevibacter kandeliae TaxID=2968473 RepID=UPI002118E6FC|nr:hypothetical protein [Aurantimonas sp. CSK15Z-1]MCQ8780989.1 hypothetical protein [Aurantimonas sp. CSK15Z-1]
MGEGSHNIASLGGARRLTDAVRAAKISAAHRSDVVIDIREADLARLEILAEVLQPVTEEVPSEDDLFDFMLARGPQPRYWVDGTAHVSMARDRRTYRLLRETRIGRVVLAESDDVRIIADRVTDYVAERIVERDRAYAVTDGISTRIADRERHAVVSDDAPLRRKAGAARASEFVVALTWLMIGVVVGAGALFAIAAWRGFTLN